MHAPLDKNVEFVNEIHRIIIKYNGNLRISEMVHEMLIMATCMALNNAPSRQIALNYMQDCINDAIDIYNDIEQREEIEQDD